MKKVNIEVDVDVLDNFIIASLKDTKKSLIEEIKETANKTKLLTHDIENLKNNYETLAAVETVLYYFTGEK